jgi:hypothetical protein
VILDLLGSADQTKIPTDCCASIFRAALICPCTARPSSVLSQYSSMKGRERPCSTRRRLRSSQNVLQRSVEPAARTGRSTIRPFVRDHTFITRRRLSLEYGPSIRRAGTPSMLRTGGSTRKSSSYLAIGNLSHFRHFKQMSGSRYILASLANSKSPGQAY